ncbi:MAG: FHA domain-containing protein [Desulfobacteraceae bacterium]|nr:MAG: FHA domain-containing protein [Desulfobacteraceae bacterium]
MNWKDDKRLLKLKVFENAQSFFERQFATDVDIKVGRAEHCDLLLRSKRISREHCHIFFRDGQWRIEDLKSQNGIHLNGVKVLTGNIRNGDVLQVGDFKIEVIWESASDTETADIEDDRTILLSSEPASDRTIVSQRAPIPADNSDSPVSRIIQPFLKNKLLMGVGIGICCILFVVIILSLSGNEPDAPEKSLLPAEQKKEEVMTDLETKHQLESYLLSGREQFDKGNFNEALVRFQAAVTIDPQNAAALDYIRLSRDKIRALEEQRRLAADEERQRLERLNALLSKIRQAASQKDYAKAQEMLAEADFLAPEDPSVKQIKEEVEKAQAEEKLREADTLRQKEEVLTQLKHHFDQGQQAFDGKKYHDALREWEALLALNIECPETAHVRQAIPLIQKQLEGEIGIDYEKGVKAYEAKDYTETLTFLQKVALVNPDYKDTKNLLAQASKSLETQARKLFQEGLVYEGLGQIEKAEERWREVIRLQPLETNEYHQRALEKLK